MNDTECRFLTVIKHALSSVAKNFNLVSSFCIEF